MWQVIPVLIHILLFIPLIVDLDMSKQRMSRKTIFLVFFTILVNAALNIPPSIKAIKECICEKLNKPRKRRHFNIQIQLPIN